MAKKVLGYVELEWVCPSCQTKNKGSQRTCITCGAPQPENTEFQQVQGNELETGEEIAAAVTSGADIHCAYCGTRNPASAAVCSQCGADLTQGKARQAGKVLGAFHAEKAAEIACPHCGSLNPPNAARCAQCGGNLPQSPTEVPQPASPQTASSFPAQITAKPVLAALILAALLLCGLLGWGAIAANRTEAMVGTLQGVQWQRAIEIEALVPVQYEAWKNEIPSEAKLGTCAPKQRYISNDPQPQSTEVCGTPYTVDTGTGKGEVAQDCQYLVYDLLCSYTQLEWRKDQEAVLQGKDYNPIWPQPSIQSGKQRLGDRIETYIINFDVNGKTYSYETNDYALFEQTKSTQRWRLNINSFGNVVSVEAVK